MEVYRVEDLTFTYPNETSPALSDVSFSVNAGEFVTLCGSSGCGKTTLLRLLKSTLSPHGTLAGNILFQAAPLTDLDEREQAARIGFVMQHPEHQIVTDKVWHELAFGLESLGYSTPEIRARVSEMASFFGIEDWFHKKVTELSGGQKQLLNLASVMVMGPSVLLLDEPTGQLSPIAAGEFLTTLKRINQELGTTVILSEHRLEEVFPLSDRVMVLDHGRLLSFAPPSDVCDALRTSAHPMYQALPTPMRIADAVDDAPIRPLTVREGRTWLASFASSHPVHPERIPTPDDPPHGELALSMKDIAFRYQKDGADVLQHFNLEIFQGEIFSLLGGNGAGKTTALSIAAGILTPHRGAVSLFGKPLSEIADPHSHLVGMLPQEVSALFVKKSVRLDLLDALSEEKLSAEEKEAKAMKVARLCRIQSLLERHPYDLSGGEMERAALAKVLLRSPKILLLDEPTRGMDADFKEVFADILAALTQSGVTVLMVSHDIEFCAKYAHRCAMVFDGEICSVGTPRTFFAGKHFYTTAANRMARETLPTAVLAEDVIMALGGTLPPKKELTSSEPFDFPEQEPSAPPSDVPVAKRGKPSLFRMILGSLFALLFLWMELDMKRNGGSLSLPFFPSPTEGEKLLAVLSLVISFLFFFPKKKVGIPLGRSRSLTKRTLFAALFALLAVPLTIFVGIYYLGDRKYYFISLLIILEVFLPFAMIFEGRKPKARELIILSVLSALAVAGRVAFFMLPEFKPVVAMVILAGVAFGGEAGFLVGALTGFVSDMYFGQGSWTPWQMFAFGLIGFLAGVLFRKGFLQETRTSLALFGAFAALVLYGGIMNPAAVLMVQPTPTKEMILSAYLVGFPLDLIHAVATVFFLWFLSDPMLEKLERIKLKYGLLEE